MQSLSEPGMVKARHDVPVETHPGAQTETGSCAADCIVAMLEE